MRALYNTTGMHFIGGELYMGHFGCEPAGDEYKCIDWMLVSEQVFGTALDQDITGQLIMDMNFLEVMKIPKTDVACFLLDGKPRALSQNSHFHLKTTKPGVARYKPDEHALLYDPRSKEHHMCQVVGKALCSLQAIHIALCLRRTLDQVAFERTKALYFYTEAQGQET
ncbi:hypothetical protein [Neptuniibacter sp.]|uniref:hypothetical protein n=1 Tax=Neptuniibacter sp. TaxID=1962643 RepID=UPI0026203BF8|nr:hypothetical protein [Neptuniibacter sp.]MCP4596427.1 hypothetical protein [Neptuniibacter sp.]